MIDLTTNANYSLTSHNQPIQSLAPSVRFFAPSATIATPEFVMKVANQPSERRQAFELCHDVYCRAGLITGDPSGMRVMRHHLAESTSVLIARSHQKVVFTVTLVGDGEYGLPMESLFADEVEQMRAQRIRLAEVSCFASNIDSDSKRERFDSLVKMVSLLFQSARRRAIDRLLLAVHPKHARAYERLFGMVRCSDERAYAAVRGNPAVLCMHDFAELDEKRYPLYDQIYGPSYSPWQLDGTNMNESEKEYYEQFLPASNELVPMAA